MSPEFVPDESPSRSDRSAMIEDRNVERSGEEMAMINREAEEAEDRDRESSLENTPDVADGVPSNDEFAPSARMSGVAKRGAVTSPETGSGGLAGQRQPLYNQASSSVERDTPNIPNVIEYHLKVKSPNGDESAVANYKQSNVSGIEMRKDKKFSLSMREDYNRNEVTPDLSKLTVHCDELLNESSELPQVFQAKYLGSQDARGLWGIKHTRKPVDNMVAAAKSLPAGSSLPLVRLVVSEDGVTFSSLGKTSAEGGIRKMYSIEDISYGVQDLIYTRVFSMIIVRETDNFRRMTPFECHGFVCESKHQTRQLTYALAEAFRVYSERVKASQNEEAHERKKYAIDLKPLKNVQVDVVFNS